MNSIKQMIRTSVATLCAMCLLSACSSTLDEALDRGNTTQTLTNIRIGDFPAFGSDVNSGTQTRSSAIGTYDPGKTTWENGDEILLKITDSKSVVTTATLVYDGSLWKPSEKLEIVGGGAIEAYYAPAYEWKDNELALKAGKSAGTEEYLTYTTSVIQLTDGFTITFGNRNYSRLRVATNFSSITLTAAGFTANDGTSTAKSGITASKDKKGNAYFYGTWATDSEAVISTDNTVKTYGTIEFQTKKITLPEAKTARSYAVAGPKWKINSSCYYQWDAKTSYTEGGEYNKGSIAINSCKDAPTKDDLMKYLGAGVYWDDGEVGAHQQSYTIINDIDGETYTYHNGLWMMKMSYIDKLNPAVVPVESVNYERGITYGRPDDIEKYFFLPAAGLYYEGDLYEFGSSGGYWSSTSIFEDGNYYAYYLYMNSADIGIYYDDNTSGYLPMVRE